MAEKRHKRNSTFKKSTTVNTVICYDQVVISNKEENLQKAAYKLNQIITEHSLTTSAQKKTWEI
jgi:hypothetical protein